MIQTAPPSQLYLRHITRSVDVNDTNPFGHNIESRVLPVAIVMGCHDTENRQTRRMFVFPYLISEFKARLLTLRYKWY